MDTNSNIYEQITVIFTELTATINNIASMQINEHSLVEIKQLEDSFVNFSNTTKSKISELASVAVSDKYVTADIINKVELFKPIVAGSVISINQRYGSPGTKEAPRLVALSTTCLNISIASYGLNSFLTEISTSLQGSTKNTASSNTNSNTNQRKQIPNAVVALFCSYINHIGIDKMNEDETIEAYCHRICENNNLNYTDKVRQNFSHTPTKGNIKKLKELLLPQIEQSIATRITQHIDSKTK